MPDGLRLWLRPFGDPRADKTLFPIVLSRFDDIDPRRLFDLGGFAGPSEGESRGLADVEGERDLVNAFLRESIPLNAGCHSTKYFT